MTLAIRHDSRQMRIDSTLCLQNIITVKPNIYPRKKCLIQHAST